MNDQICDTVDFEIIMHRDAHFGGSFSVMLDYYEQDGVGVMPDFEIKAIKRLKTIEEKYKQDLSTLLLPDDAKKAVADAKALYHQLRDIYKDEQPKDPLPRLMSDLVLSEEEQPEKELSALIEYGKNAVPSLINLIKSTTFFDPLNPGYGRIPIFAAYCLAKIGDESALIPLFEALGQDNFFTDEAIIKAICSFGDKAKAFLLKVLAKLPLSNDNEHAAIALSGFAQDQEIAKTCLALLEKKEVQQATMFATYLIFMCSGLESDICKERFKGLSKTNGLSKALNEEMTIIVKSWKK